MQETDKNLTGSRVAPAPDAFDPFELPDTIQLGTIDDPYPHFAAARRAAPVQRTWPLPDVLSALDDGNDDPSLHVLGYDEALTVLRDHET
ncbi:MAG TPA: hypothetical protein VEP49_15830, partial [Acidimicrobiia bacterium]|nr:hypothetical protein [Acidimicrobiia bacterium]